ncbi:BTB/POZ domain-containing adapter for CUL3-mediated RhoA degradation protein 2 [Pseudoliparis swirei]|uniref:BTB/POZ domain-containing adapter for CUL3-mediated RhoA degradation protein 2 n=1 Tax=Pseudoliparis swirei TaxID=2059687 RepID=UPI0024BD931A|nr:BTB/POZ domain-containing adapter for CUL3-mediated RhoA degradation protein 2 [Pseudoliparis swirei]
MSGDSRPPQRHTHSASPAPPPAGPKTKSCSYRGAVGLGNKYIRINVGGSLFYATLPVLTRHSSLLKAMFSGQKDVFTDKDGWILIDRSGKHFGSVLCFIRDGSVSLPKGRQAVQEVLAEAKYYDVQGLVELCHNTLQGNKELPMCVIPVVTSSKEEEKLIQSSAKPVVKLVYNRSNNKYSYTSNSDDHLLKNIELFDRLSLSFNGRVLFIKDVIGDEICCWSFYGQGRKLAEVCCTSIVYATEKKQTKVEFPEARIYEETLNTLLYETMSPDAVLLEASEEDEGPGGARRLHVKRHSAYDDRQPDIVTPFL